MKKTISLLLALFMLLCMMPSALAQEGITVLVNGNKVAFDVSPLIENGRTLVPARAIAEALGATVSWADGTVTIEQDTDILYHRQTMIIGDNTIEYITWKKGVAHTDESRLIHLDVPPMLISSRTFIPLRAVAEVMDCTVEWEEDTRTVCIETVQAPNATFVATLMQKLPKDQNYVVSPLSLKLAMLMAANGATGDTQDEILTAFDLLDINEANEETRALMESLNHREYGEIHLANSIWFNEDYYPTEFQSDFSQGYKDVIKSVFGGTAQSVHEYNSVEAVNEWVKQNTNGKISQLLSEENREYLSVLVNTVYMKSSWIAPFDEYATTKDTFTDFSGAESQVDFMHQTEHFLYYEKDGVRALRLPYENNLSMYLVLGDATDADMTAIRENSTYQKVHLSLPKFKTEFSLSLRDILQEMGIIKAFVSGNHDFDSMLTNVPDPVRIDDVLQKAIIEVDESGTEAAAATAVIIKASGAILEPEPIVEFCADHPFTYFIIDEPSGEVLFAGRFVTPSK